MQFELPMGATDRVRELADVRIDPDLGQVEGAGVIVLGGAVEADAALLDRAGETRVLIATPGIGLDKIDVAAASERNVLVTHTPDAPTESTAEHTVALLMAAAARVVAGDRSMRGDESIDRADLLGTELLDRNLGVVGYGRIGRRVSEICALGLKMKVTAHDPNVELAQPTPPGVTLTDDLDRLLVDSMFVTLHVPLLPTTRRLIGERELRLMPRGGYLINAARGAVVDEQALIRVLQSGHLAGAALDVTDPEPPATGNPLLQMKNVITTPHIASGTDRGIHTMMHGVADQVIQVLNRERPRYLVNPQVWPGRLDPIR